MYASYDLTYADPPKYDWREDYDAVLYRIAEEAFNGCDDKYIRDLCAEAALKFDRTASEVYRDSENVYRREFERF